MHRGWRAVSFRIRRSADVRNVFMKRSKVVCLHHYSTGDLWHNRTIAAHSDVSSRMERTCIARKVDSAVERQATC